LAAPCLLRGRPATEPLERNPSAHMVRSPVSIRLASRAGTRYGNVGMGDDYAKTADQMMFDARSLREAGAHRNACYLAGYVVECTLKTLLELAGLPPKQTHDLESLHQVVLLHLLSNPVVIKYGNPASLAPTMLQQIAPAKTKQNGSTQYFCHWDPYHRYDGSRWNSEPMSKAYLHEADKCIEVITTMLIDGVL
jgi:hypothetical protein